MSQVFHIYFILKKTLRSGHFLHFTTKETEKSSNMPKTAEQMRAVQHEASLSVLSDLKVHVPSNT